MVFCFSGDSVGDKSQPCLQPHHLAFSISSARCTWCGTRLNPAASLGDALCKKLVLALCVPAVPGKLSVVDHLLAFCCRFCVGWLAGPHGLVQPREEYRTAKSREYMAEQHALRIQSCAKNRRGH